MPLLLNVTINNWFIPKSAYTCQLLLVYSLALAVHMFSSEGPSVDGFVEEMSQSDTRLLSVMQSFPDCFSSLGLHTECM